MQVAAVPVNMMTRQQSTKAFVASAGSARAPLYSRPRNRRLRTKSKSGLSGTFRNTARSVLKVIEVILCQQGSRADWPEIVTSSCKFRAASRSLFALGVLRLFGFLKRKVLNQSAPWKIKEGVVDNEPFLTKRLASLPPVAKRLQMPHMVSIGWAYDGEGSRRLPNPQEWRRIGSCEAALSLAAEKNDAVLVGSLTSDGFHQFVVYCDNPAEIQVHLVDSLPQLLERPDQAEKWEIGTTFDPSWEMAERI